MSARHTRPVLCAALTALLLLTACGDDGGTASSGGGGEGGSGAGAEGGSGGEDGGLELTVERVAELEVADIRDVVATDDGLLALRGDLTDDEQLLIGLGTDGTVTEVADLSGASPRYAGLFATGAGTFVTAEWDEGCGYASVDPATGAVGEPVVTDTDEYCYAPVPTRIDETEVVFVNGATFDGIDLLAIIDTADGSSTEVPLDLELPGDPESFGTSVTATDDAIYVTRSAYGQEGPTGEVVAKRFGRDGTPGPTAEVPGDILAAGSALVAEEWTDANDDDVRTPDEVARFRVDPDTLATDPLDPDDPLATCPRGDLRFTAHPAGVWTFERDSRDAPFTVHLVDPDECTLRATIELEALPEEGDGATTSMRSAVVDGDLYLVRTARPAWDQESGEPVPDPIAAYLDRVTVA